MDPGQDEVIKALQSAAAAGGRGPLARIDTHLSHVFLGASRVYKLKRAVRMPFVDFSTPDLRKAACESELEVNLRFAPNLYLGVEPVVRRPGGTIALGGPGEPLDWVVVMRRFADEALFDTMARAGTLRPDLVAEAVEVVAQVHEETPPSPDSGRPQDYLAIVKGLRRTDADGAAIHGLAVPSPDLHDALDRAIVKASGLIERRRQDGKVRRGHGDLHLRNLCLFEGRATPFDALEFDPALATADVLYDLAFLLMDLHRRDLPLHANTAMNAYWNAAREEETGLALLPLFMALRADVRAAVAMEAGGEAEARTYRTLGLALLQPTPARLVAVGGLSGSGKSAAARQLAPLLPGACGARILRTDVIRKAGGAPVGAGAFRPDRRAAVYRTLAEHVADALAAGAAVVADATFQDAPARAAVTGLAPACTALWLRAPVSVRAGRVSGRTGDASEATAAVAAAQTEPALESGWTVIDAKGPLADVVARARAVLGLGDPGESPDVA